MVDGELLLFLKLFFFCMHSSRCARRMQEKTNQKKATFL